MTREDIAEWVAKCGAEDVLLADGLEDAFVGLTQGGVAVYDAERCVQAIMKDSELDYEEALEYLEFNTFCAYVGPKTPVFIQTMKANNDI